MSSRPPDLDVPSLEALDAPSRVGIVGCGLIGGSILLRCREVGQPVVAFDTSAGLRAQLETHGFEVAERLDALLARCDLVVVAVAPDSVGEVWAQIAAAAGARDGRVVVIDASSTKTPVIDHVEAGEVGWANERACFVLSHPMAGREQAGWPAAIEDLFVGAAWIVCPREDVRSTELVRVLRFVASMGARACFMPAGEHDRFAALVSHLPHLIAFAYRHLLEEVDPAGAWWRFSGGSLADVLRVSESDPVLWREILRGNATELGAAAAELSERMADSWRAVDAPSRRPGGSGWAPAEPQRVRLPARDELGDLARRLAGTGVDGLEVVEARRVDGTHEIDLDRRAYGAVASRFTTVSDDVEDSSGPAAT